MLVLLFNNLYSQNIWGDQNEKNEKDGACSMYGGEIYTGVWWGNLRKRDYLGDRRSWEDNIKMGHQEVGRHGLD